MEVATEMVRVVQNLYLRGELSESRLADVLEIDPNAAKNWNKMKLKMKIRRRKLMKRTVDILKVGLRKSNQCTRKKKKKEKSKLENIEREFYGNGLHILETYVEFMKEAEKRMT